jgi:ketosteroid isomerase-like protein
MEKHADVATVRVIYDAMAAGDFGRLLGLLDDSCVITQDTAVPWGGRFVGPDGFAHFGLTLREHIESQVTIDAVFAADGDVYEVGRTRGTALRSGRSFDVAEVHRWTIRDGKAVAAHFAIDNAAMLEALALL